MGHGTVADEIKGRAGARRAHRLDPRDRRGGRALPLLPRRLGALHGARDLDGGPGRARLGHRARVRRVHAVQRHPRVHRALDRAHAPLARPLPGLARRARARRTRSSTGSCRAASTRTCARASAQEVAARDCGGIAIGGSLGEDKAQMYEVVGLGGRRAARGAPAPPARDRRRSTTCCAASSWGSTPSTARCRRGSAATAWPSCPTPRRAGASTSPRAAAARPTSRSWRAARARPARAATPAPTCTTCSRRARRPSRGC